MTREEAIEFIKIDISRLGNTPQNLAHKEALEMAIKALEQKPYEDAISRQAVLEIAKSSKSNWIDNSVLFKRVNELPSVNPQPKTGYWIILPPIFEEICKCSNCHKMFKEALQFSCKPCPNCGARMVDPQESEEV